MEGIIIFHIIYCKGGCGFRREVREVIQLVSEGVCELMSSTVKAGLLSPHKPFRNGILRFCQVLLNSNI